MIENTNAFSTCTAWLGSRGLGCLVAASVLALWQPLAAQPASAPAAAAAKPAKPLQPLFAQPEAGFEALIAALRASDAKQLARLLGPGHERIIDSGDNAADREAWARFVANYDTRHVVQLQGDAKAILSTGSEDWPMPIPLVKRPGGWAFDADAGEEELVARRIGRNELDTIQVCLAFVDMQREYAEQDRNGNGALEYAAKWFSSPGKRDGLYWPVKEGEALSPGGPQLAAADAKRKAQRNAVPYRGYYYRMLFAQGKDAPGGARDFRVDGKLIGGIALLAYPASYLNSGIKTFTCSIDGVVFERDFGPGTNAAAAKITLFNPDSNWARAK